MATVVVTVISLFFLSAIPFSDCFGLIADFLDEVSPCEQSCVDTYPLHTYDRVNMVHHSHGLYLIIL